MCHVMVDDEDYSVAVNIRWYLSTHGYPMAVINKRSVYLHRLVMGSPRGIKVDHKNGNLLDARKSELRTATSGENSRNRVRLQRNNKSGVHGVSWNRRRSQWLASLEVDYRSIFLGWHTTIEAASAARRAAELKYYGSFAPSMYHNNESQTQVEQTKELSNVT